VAFQTVQQLVSDVRTLLTASSPRTFSDAEIIQFLNYAWKDFADRSEILEAESIQTVTAATADYTLPTDCSKVIRVRVYGRRCSYLDERQKATLDFDGQSLTTQGIPLYYTIWGETLSLYPVPNTTYSTGTNRLYIYYYKTPADITIAAFTTDIQTLGIPPESAKGLVDYAASELLTILGDLPRAGLYRQKYLESVQYAREAGVKERDRFYVVKDDEAVYTDDWSVR
jgi:hypothetical protein